MSVNTGPSTCCDSAEYQAGYRSCLAGVGQYLLMSDTGSVSRSMLTRLTSGLTDSRVLRFSTAESDASQARRQSGQTDAYRAVSEICHTERISVAQLGTSGTMHMKTRHTSLKNDPRFLSSLKQNYWRPW